MKTAALLFCVLTASSLLNAEEKPTTVPPITGQCRCGQVAYEAQAPAVESNYCDCRACQKATGAMKGAYVVVRQAGFRVVRGEPTAYRGTTGVKCDAHGVWHFCATCGSPLYWKPNKGKTVDLHAGSLDDRKVFQPKE